MFEREAQRSLQALLNPFSRELTAAELAARAIVFSPHQDDETLGCGGTIARKCRSGGSVDVVYLTDGTSSHRLLPSEKLKQLRREEALSACKVLGVAESRVRFLDFPDGRLQQCREPAAERIAALLRGHQPEQVFVPYSRDTTPDHQAAHAIVLDAISQAGIAPVIFEYPVWFWTHWPWAAMPMDGRREIPRRVALSMRSSVSLLKELRWFVPIDDVMEQKRTALAQHRSQMERLVPEHTWLTLHDVAGGGFLDCFFWPRELFFRRIR